MGTPVWFTRRIVCTGVEPYKKVVKMTFAKGAAVKGPSGLFNSSLEGNCQARHRHSMKAEKVRWAALMKDLIRAAVAINLRERTSRKLRNERAASGPD